MREAELVDLALSISAAGGAVADAIKKAVYHGHNLDWAMLMTLAEELRLNADTLALAAEHQIDLASAQASLGLS